jgi:hypothetical protein
MATILDALRSVNAYPIPMHTLVETAERYKLSISADATQACLHGRDYLLAKADLLRWLSFAPNITQNGISFSFTDEQRHDFRKEADRVAEECGGDETRITATYGYKGSKL